MKMHVSTYVRVCRLGMCVSLFLAYHYGNMSGHTIISGTEYHLLL